MARRLSSPFLTTIATAATLIAGAGCGTTVVFEGSDGAGGQGATTGQGGSGAQGGTGQGGSGGGQTPCPADAPAHGSPCSGGATCKYPLVPCGEAVAICDGSTWEVLTEPYECNPPPCPIDKPADGAFCPNILDGQICAYTSDWPCPDIPVDAICDNGQWKVNEPLCNPPPPQPCQDYSDPNLCEGDPSCRWIVPGCGANPLDDAQCFPAVGCDQDPFACTDAEICAEISHDPCWGSMCQACHTPVYLCLGDDSDV